MDCGIGGLNGTPDGAEAVGAFLEVGQVVPGGDDAGGGAEGFREPEDVVVEEDAALELASAHVGEEHEQVARGGGDAAAAGRQGLVLEPNY